MAMISRLSPENIVDELRRVPLYREIRERQGVATIDDWTEYEVQPNEELSADLISYNVYKTAELKWLILIAAKLDDMRGRIVAGTILVLPSKAWVRNRIKHYTDLEKKARW
jgi:hypothetical protein